MHSENKKNAYETSSVLRAKPTTAKVAHISMKYPYPQGKPFLGFRARIYFIELFCCIGSFLGQPALVFHPVSLQPSQPDVLYVRLGALQKGDMLYRKNDINPLRQVAFQLDSTVSE